MLKNTMITFTALTGESYEDYVENFRIFTVGMNSSEARYFLTFTVCTSIEELTNEVLDGRFGRVLELSKSEYERLLELKKQVALELKTDRASKDALERGFTS